MARLLRPHAGTFFISNATKQGLKIKWGRAIVLLVSKPQKSLDYGAINATRDA